MVSEKWRCYSLNRLNFCDVFGYPDLSKEKHLFFQTLLEKTFEKNVKSTLLRQSLLFLRKRCFLEGICRLSLRFKLLTLVKGVFVVSYERRTLEYFLENVSGAFGLSFWTQFPLVFSFSATFSSVAPSFSKPRKTFFFNFWSWNCGALPLPSFRPSFPCLRNLSQHVFLARQSGKLFPDIEKKTFQLDTGVKKFLLFSWGKLQVSAQSVRQKNVDLSTVGGLIQLLMVECAVSKSWSFGKRLRILEGVLFVPSL